MKIQYCWTVLLFVPLLAQAEIYKAVDADGHVTYSSAPIKGGKKIILEPLPTMAPPARARSTASPADFPKVDGDTQKGRDDTRRKILQDELSTEQKLLEEAKQNLAAGAPNPPIQQTIVVGQTKNGAPITQQVTRRNVAAYEEKMKALNDQVDLHQKNIDALNTEISKLK